MLFELDSADILEPEKEHGLLFNAMKGLCGVVRPMTNCMEVSYSKLDA